MIKKFASTLFFLLVGFAGGCLGPSFMSWFKGAVVSVPDAIAIANTYIVFTTIIFVGFTVILGVMGYALTHQLSASRQSHEKDLFEGMKDKLESDENWGIDFSKAVLKNPDVLRHLEKVLSEKVAVHIDTLQCEVEQDAKNVAVRKQAVDGLASKIKKQE